MRLFVLVCWCVIFVPVAHGADDDFKYRPRPAAQQPKVGAWPGGAESDGPAWGNSSVRIPLKPGQTGVTYAPATQPVAVVGQEVYDLKTGQQIAAIEGEYDRKLTALSPDGKRFAARPEGDRNNQVVVWSAETGKVEFTVETGGADKATDFIGFAGGNAPMLITAARSGTPSIVETWDLNTGKLVKRFQTERIDAKKAALSPDGRYLAVVGYNSLRVYDTRSGALAATMRNPVIPARDRTPPDGGNPARGRPNRAGQVEAADVVFVYAWTSDLRFSANGKELVGLFTHPEPRLVIWDNRGEVVFNEPCPPALRDYPHQERVAMSPDGSMLLLHGTALFDRKSKKVVWRTRVPWASETPPMFLDHSTLLLGTAAGNGAHAEMLEAVAVPMAEIRKSVEAMNNPRTAAHLRPGQAVSVTVDVINIRAGDKEATRKQLENALAQRLERDGIKVAANQNTTLYLNYDELAGEKAKVVEKASPFDRVGRDTGREVEQTRGVAVIELRVKGQAKPVWSTEDQAHSARSFREEITEESVRKSMLEAMLGKLRELDLPYFLPADGAVTPLPLGETGR